MNEMLHDILMWAISITAGVVAFVAGWFLSSPCWRILHRVAFRKAIGGGVLGTLRLGTAGLLAAGAFYLAWHWGPGGGGGGFGGLGGPGNGKGKDSGAGSNVKVDARDKVGDGKTQKPLDTKSRETIDVEVLGAHLYKGENKFYRVQRKEPPVTLDEVKKYVLDKNNNVGIVHIIRIRKVSQDEALGELDAMLRDNGIELKEIPEPSKAEPAK